MSSLIERSVIINNKITDLEHDLKYKSDEYNNKKFEIVQIKNKYAIVENNHFS